jgi:hypothetical protein
MREKNAGRPSVDAAGFKIPQFLDARSVRKAAEGQRDTRVAAALDALAMIMDGVAPDEAARTAGTRTGTVQIVLARIAAEGSLEAAAGPEQSNRERELRARGSGADVLERVSALFLDRLQGERVRWLSAFYRGTPAALISDAVGVSEEEVLDWAETLQASGLSAFRDEGGIIRALPEPTPPIREVKPRREPGRPSPETEEQIAARTAARAEAAARDERRRQRRDEAVARMRPPAPDPAEIRARMVGTRSADEMAFLVATAMHEEQKHRLEALILAAESSDVAMAGERYGYDEKTMYRHGRVLSQKGPGGLLPNRAPAQPFVPKFNRAELSAVEALAESRRGGEPARMRAVLQLLDGGYPPEVARDLGVDLDELADVVGSASRIALAARHQRDDDDARDLGNELSDAGYVSGDFAALMSSHHSEDERLRAKALRMLVRGEPLARVAASLVLDEEVVEQWADDVLDEGAEALLDERQEHDEGSGMSPRWRTT